MNRYTRHKWWLRYTLSFFIAIVLGTVSLNGSSGSGYQWLSSAQAAESDHSGDHSDGHGGSQGGHGGGHDTDHGDDHSSGHSPGPGGHGSRGTHRGGHGNEVDRGGGRAVEDRILRGQRPVWAQEGIPEVELGRLNVSRAPARVLNRAEAEALATYSEEMAAIYSLDAAQAAELLKTSFREISRYDSPVQNLALYKDVMTFGDTQLREIDTSLTPASQLDLAAIFLGSASDKTIPISENTVIALNRILGLNELSSEDRSTLATKAEVIREAILIGHGPTEDH